MVLIPVHVADTAFLSALACFKQDLTAGQRGAFEACASQLTPADFKMFSRIGEIEGARLPFQFLHGLH